MFVCWIFSMFNSMFHLCCSVKNPDYDKLVTVAFDVLFVFHYNHSCKCLERRLYYWYINKGNNKITELRTILQRESQNS